MFNFLRGINEDFCRFSRLIFPQKHTRPFIFDEDP